MSFTKYILFHSHYSLPSIIARFLVEMRGTSVDGIERVFEERITNIFEGEQLSALFRGGRDVQDIPALRLESTADPSTGSLGITQHLSEIYPGSLPERYAELILRWITSLANLDWFSLSLPVPQNEDSGDDENREGLDLFKSLIQARSGKNASGWYRAALMYRLKIIEDDSSETARIYHTRDRARRLLLSIEQRLGSELDGNWALGMQDPTALDAHLVPSLARLEDAGNKDLIPEMLKRYLDRAKASRYWRDVMGDRRTLR